MALTGTTYIYLLLECVEVYLFRLTPKEAKLR
jgi:hypothetical protein